MVSELSRAMEHQGEVADARKASGFLHDFLSRFSATCREDAAGPSATTGVSAASQPAIAASEAKLLLVRVAGEVLFHCSSNLAEVRGVCLWELPRLSAPTLLPNTRRFVSYEGGWTRYSHTATRYS